MRALKTHLAAFSLTCQFEYVSVFVVKCKGQVCKAVCSAEGVPSICQCSKYIGMHTEQVRVCAVSVSLSESLCAA